MAMKRKIIQIANSTQLVSLPRKWCLLHDLKKGDELDVEEQGNSLIVSTERQIQLPQAEADVTGFDRTTLLYLLRSLYKRGYDEIKLTYKNPVTHHHRTGKDLRIISVVHEEVNRLPGMEVIHDRENYCVIKAISNADTTELESVLRRVFILILDSSNDLIEGAKSGDPVKLLAIQEKHDSITRFISYCLRLINRNPKAQKSDYFLYHIIAVLDKVIDSIHVASRDLLKHKKKINNQTVELLRLVHENLDMFYKGFYKFEPKPLGELNRNREQFKKLLAENQTKLRAHELQTLYSIQPILDYIRTLTESRMAMEY